MRDEIAGPGLSQVSLITGPDRLSSGVVEITPLGGLREVGLRGKQGRVSIDGQVEASRRRSLLDYFRRRSSLRRYLLTAAMRSCRPPSLTERRDSQRRRRP